MAYSNEIKTNCLEAVMSGMTLRQVQRKYGPSRMTIGRWASEVGIAMRQDWSGGPVVPVKKVDDAKKPARLGLAQRLAIAIGLAAGDSYGKIALGIGFTRWTVSREIKRYSIDGFYNPYKAQSLATQAAQRPKERKIDMNQKLRDYVLEKLANRWSPEQISISLKYEYPEDEEMWLSSESIYQALYVQGKGALREELKLEKALRSGRKNRIPRSSLPPKSSGKSWVEGCEITLRPPEAEDRAVPGHWEGDLILGGDMKSCLITLVERTTRLVLTRRLDLHPTLLITSELASMIEDIPRTLMRSITWDQGCEMAAHTSFTEKTGVKVYFCDPHSPWQRGSNENTNGLIRDYFPKGTDFSKVTDKEVQIVQDQLNTRIRKTLSWKSPIEAYMEYLKNAA